MRRTVIVIFIALILSGTLLAGGPEFLDDSGRALDEAWERGAPVALIYTRDG